jgi:hypothetical protein
VDNSAANAALTKQIATLRALPQRLRDEAIPEVAKTFEAEMRGNITAGRAPDGTPWQKTAEGEQPLKNAGKALTVKVIGTVVLARITGPEALHHLGQAAGKIRRQILPTKNIPDTMTAAIKTALRKIYLKIAGGNG